MNGHFEYEMAKLRIAEDLRWAERERLARHARNARKNGGAADEPHQGIGFSLRRLITHPSGT